MIKYTNKKWAKGTGLPRYILSSLSLSMILHTCIYIYRYIICIYIYVLVSERLTDDNWYLDLKLER